MEKRAFLPGPRARVLVIQVTGGALRSQGRGLVTHVLGVHRADGHASGFLSRVAVGTEGGGRADFSVVNPAGPVAGGGASGLGGGGLRMASQTILDGKIRSVIHFIDQCFWHHGVVANGAVGRGFCADTEMEAAIGKTDAGLGVAGDAIKAAGGRAPSREGGGVIHGLQGVANDVHRKSPAMAIAATARLWESFCRQRGVEFATGINPAAGLTVAGRTVAGDASGDLA